MHSGAIQSAGQGLHSLKKKTETVLPTVRDFQFRNLGNFYLWNPETGKILIVESEFLGFGIRNTAQRIRNSLSDWNPESTFHWQRLESAIHGVEFSIYGCLGFPLMHGAKSFIALNWSYLLLLYFARLNFHEFCTDFTYPWFSRTWGRRRIQQSSTKQLFAQKGFLIRGPVSNSEILEKFTALYNNACLSRYVKIRLLTYFRSSYLDFSFQLTDFLVKLTAVERYEISLQNNKNVQTSLSLIVTS